MLWLVLFLSALTPADAQCDVGWKYFAGTHSCFQMFPRLGDFYSNDLFCHQQNARLASLTTKEETDFVRNFVKAENPRSIDWPFLGLTAPSTDCNWLWLDGSSLNTSAVRWYPGKPSACKKTSICTSVLIDNKSNNDQNMILVDVLCDVQRKTLCKKAALTTAPVEVKMPCEDGWLFYEETHSCYKHFVRPAKYDTSLSHCKSFDAKLVDIETSRETLFLKDIITKGTIKSPRDFSFIDLNVNDQDCVFRWSDSSPLNQSAVKFNLNQHQKPNWCRAGQACAVFQASWAYPDWYTNPRVPAAVSTWFKGGPLAIIDDMTCWLVYNRVMCKKGAVKSLEGRGVCQRGWSKVEGSNACRKDSRNNPTPLHKSGDPPCEAGWSYFEATHSCFKNFHHTGSFLDADSFCHDQKARLVSLTTREETAFLTKLVSGDYLTSGADTSYVGLTAVNHDCVFTWLDGSPLNTSAVGWEPKSPDFCGGRSQCAKLSPAVYSNVMLDDVDCENVLKRTLCKKSAQPIRLSTKGKGECEEGWTYYNATKSCYKNFARPVTFERSKSHCRSFGGEMHSVSTYGETIFVSDLVRKGPIPTWKHMPFSDVTAFEQNCYFKGPDLKPVDIATYFHTGKLGSCADDIWCTRWHEVHAWRGAQVLTRARCKATMYRVLCKKDPIGSEIREDVVCKDGWVRLEKTNTCVKKTNGIPQRSVDESSQHKCESMPFASYFQFSTGICFVQSDHCASVPYPAKQIRNPNFDSVAKILKKRRMSTDPAHLCAFGQTPLCRTGEKSKDGHCFWTTENSDTWSAASNECQKNDGTLFVPHNDKDMQNVLDFFKSERPSLSAVWLGLVSAEKWSSLDGTTVDYFRWTGKYTDHSVSSVLASLFLVDAVSAKDGSYSAHMQAKPENGSFRGICSRSPVRF